MTKITYQLSYFMLHTIQWIRLTYDAIAAVKRVLSLPQYEYYPDAFLRLVLAYTLKGEAKNAEESLVKGLALHPSHPGLLAAAKVIDTFNNRSSTLTQKISSEIAENRSRVSNLLLQVKGKPVEGTLFKGQLESLLSKFDKLENNLSTPNLGNLKLDIDTKTFSKSGGFSNFDAAKEMSEIEVSIKKLQEELSVFNKEKESLTQMSMTGKIKM